MLCLTEAPVLLGLAGGTASALFGAGHAFVDTINPAAPVRGNPHAPRPAFRFATNYRRASDDEAVRDRLNQFTTDYPNVSISIEASSGNAQLTKIKLDATADRLPDLSNYRRLHPSFGLGQVARAGKLADLTAWTRADPTYAGLFDAATWATATLDGKTYAYRS